MAENYKEEKKIFIPIYSRPFDSWKYLIWLTSPSWPYKRLLLEMSSGSFFRSPAPFEPNDLKCELKKYYVIRVRARPSLHDPDTEFIL